MLGLIGTLAGVVTFGLTGSWVLGLVVVVGGFAAEQVANLFEGEYGDDLL